MSYCSVIINVINCKFALKFIWWSEPAVNNYFKQMLVKLKLFWMVHSDIRYSCKNSVNYHESHNNTDAHIPKKVNTEWVDLLYINQRIYLKTPWERISVEVHCNSWRLRIEESLDRLYWKWLIGWYEANGMTIIYHKLWYPESIPKSTPHLWIMKQKKLKVVTN